LANCSSVRVLGFNRPLSSRAMFAGVPLNEVTGLPRPCGDEPSVDQA
jgi:hypothetical protein